MTRDDFAIFICTHGRPNKQLTLDALLKAGYTGKWYLVLDDTDETIQQYVDNYDVDHILIFDKNHYINSVRTSMSQPYYKCILYAKCAVEDIAVDMKLNCFVVCDDDITDFSIRFPEKDKLRRYSRFNIDEVFNAYAEFMLDADVTIMGIGHGGVYFSGAKLFEPKNLTEIINRGMPYNFIFRNTNNSVSWTSAYGEDDITNNANSIVGKKVFLMPFIHFGIVPSGNCSDGGMQEVYVNVSGFKLMFFIFMHYPTSVRVMLKSGRTQGFNWWGTKRFRENVCPRIISQSYRRF